MPNIWIENFYKELWKRLSKTPYLSSIYDNLDPHDPFDRAYLEYLKGAIGGASGGGIGKFQITQDTLKQFLGTDLSDYFIKLRGLQERASLVDDLIASNLVPSSDKDYSKAQQGIKDVNQYISSSLDTIVESLGQRVNQPEKIKRIYSKGILPEIPEDIKSLTEENPYTLFSPQTDLFTQFENKYKAPEIHDRGKWYDPENLFKTAVLAAITIPTGMAMAGVPIGGAGATSIGGTGASAGGWAEAIAPNTGMIGSTAASFNPTSWLATLGTQGGNMAGFSDILNWVNPGGNLSVSGGGNFADILQAGDLTNLANIGSSPLSIPEGLWIPGTTPEGNVFLDWGALTGQTPTTPDIWNISNPLTQGLPGAVGGTPDWLSGLWGGITGQGGQPGLWQNVGEQARKQTVDTVLRKLQSGQGSQIAQGEWDAFNSIFANKGVSSIPGTFAPSAIYGAPSYGAPTNTFNPSIYNQNIQYPMNYENIINALFPGGSGSPLDIYSSGGSLLANILGGGGGPQIPGLTNQDGGDIFQNLGGLLGIGAGASKGGIPGLIESITGNPTVNKILELIAAGYSGYSQAQEAQRKRDWYENLYAPQREYQQEQLNLFKDVYSPITKSLGGQLGKEFSLEDMSNAYWLKGRNRIEDYFKDIEQRSSEIFAGSGMLGQGPANKYFTETLPQMKAKSLEDLAVDEVLLKEDLRQQDIANKLSFIGRDPTIPSFKGIPPYASTDINWGDLLKDIIKPASPSIIS